MLPKFILCIIVGVAIASSNPGFKDDLEYTYEIRGKTVASLHDVSDKHTGILLKAKLILRPTSDENLYARISNGEYSQIYTAMPEGWNTQIFDDHVTWKHLKLSEKPFKIVMNHGIVQDVIVNGETSNWEANIIRSVVSQFQLDTKAQNIIPSPVNTLPKGENTATFKTMEDTVTGTTETLYDIHLLPEYVIQNKPWLASKHSANEQVIEIVKHKNYTNGVERPSYHYGLFKMGALEPTANKMGDFFVRSSTSRITVTGNLNRFTIQNTYTVNTMMVSPDLVNKQRGSVVSIMNVTLYDVRKQTVKPHEVSDPISLGSLVYRYNEPYGTQKVRPNHNNYDEDELISSEESLLNQGRFRRSIEERQRLYNDLIYTSIRERYSQVQPLDQLEKAPQAPLLPLTMGYMGNSIKQNQVFNVVESAQNIARGISHDLKAEHPEDWLRKDVLAQFTILASLARVMDAEELKLTAEELYRERHGDKMAWIAYRDALAESGTGPALVTAQWLIETEKLSNEEASNVVSTFGLSVREPSVEYIRTFYSLYKNDKIRKHQNLKETILLTVTDLIRKVYVSKHESHNQYPVHSFGSFRTEEGKSFIFQTVIPDLQQKLQQAVTEENSMNILLYTRAIGNIGHRNILSVFEPYLEGRKPVTQFQRLWMVISLDKLVKTDAVRARSVLYKIYQNLGENPQIRAIAVFQIMRTTPPSDLLQHMAEFTNIDTSKTVNAAVKTSLENAAEMRGPEFTPLAKSAIPFLTKENFDISQARNEIRSYVMEKLNIMYKHTLQYVRDSNSFIPSMLKFAYRTANGGMRHQWIIAQGVVSSVDELINVLKGKTQHQEQTQTHQNSQWSSENIARLLNLKSEQREQLEGAINIEMGSLRKLFSFNNQTFEAIPTLMQMLESQLEHGKSFELHRFTNRDEMAFSFPTEMGFPFLYTYDKPYFITIQGNVEGSAKPKISSGNKIHMPETVSGNLDMNLVLSSKIMGKLSFITPFDHQQYTAGYDKVYQFNIPLKQKVNVDLKDQQIKIEIEPSRHAEKINIFHMSTWPYLSTHNIMNLEPLSLKNHLITQRIQRSTNQIIGKEETGMAIHVVDNREYDEGVTLYKMVTKIMQGDCYSAELRLQRRYISVDYQPKDSLVKKLTIHLGKLNKYRSKSHDDKHDLSHLYNTPSQSIARQQDFERKAGSNIHNAEIAAYDASFEFEGKASFKYTFTGAVAKSNVDPKSRILFYFKRYSNHQNKKPYQFAMSSTLHIPNTNDLNFMEALKHEPTAHAQVFVAYGHQYETSSKIKAEIELSRNKDTRQEISDDGLHHACNIHMRSGDRQSPACANLTRRANRMDVIRMKLQHHNIDDKTSRWTSSLYGLLRMNWMPMVEVMEERNGPKDECNFEFRMNPSWRSMNASMHVQGEFLKVADFPLGVDKFLNQQKAYCVVEETAINDFNNRTYQETLNDKWTVLFQYVPQVTHHHLSVEEQLRKHGENYVVLARKVKHGKEIKITLNTQDTHGQNIEIDMKPSEETAHPPRVLVNGETIKVSENKAYDLRDGLVEIYALNSYEVKIIVKNALSIVFDSYTIKLNLNNGKFVNSIRGICGSYNENPQLDQVTPENCVVGRSSRFMESFRINESKQRQSNNNNCHKQKVLYANVISDIDAGRNNQYNEQLGKIPKACTIFQTRYKVDNKQICFTRNPHPVCKCQQHQTETKEVAVHCVDKNSVTDMWISQIEKGLSPDFSNKSMSKMLPIDMPIKCSV